VILQFPLLNGHRGMRRVELTEATLQGWARLDAAQRQRFFEAFVGAALRLGPLELRAWLLRRLQTHPLAVPPDAASLLGDTDISLWLKAADTSVQEEVKATGNGSAVAREQRMTMPSA
jgi:hypothetical protein